MSTHAIPLREAGSDLDDHEMSMRVLALCTELIRRPTEHAATATGWTLTFTPDLSAQEQATLDRILRVARMPFHITANEYQALAGAVDDLRTFRQRSTAEWNAMTAAQRDQAIIGGVNAVIDVLRTILRD